MPFGRRSVQVKEKGKGNEGGGGAGRTLLSILRRAASYVPPLSLRRFYLLLHTSFSSVCGWIGCPERAPGAPGHACAWSFLPCQPLAKLLPHQLRLCRFLSYFASSGGSRIGMCVSSHTCGGGAANEGARRQSGWPPLLLQLSWYTLSSTRPHFPLFILPLFMFFFPSAEFPTLSLCR